MAQTPRDPRAGTLRTRRTLRELAQGIITAVTGGGTGKSSLTPYAVLTGGTTSTAAVQQVSGLGTAGQVLTSNGAGVLPTWQAGGGGGLTWVQSFSAPVDGNYAWLNQGTATDTAVSEGIVLAIAGGDGTKLRARDKALASANPYTLTAAFAPCWPANGDPTAPMAGLYVRDSASGKLITLGFSWRSLSNSPYGPSVQIDEWTDPNTASTNLLVAPAPISPFLAWFRIKDDGTNRTYWTGPDGKRWTQAYTHARATFITPTNCGFFVMGHSNNAPGPVQMTLLSWQETNP